MDDKLKSSGHHISPTFTMNQDEGSVAEKMAKKIAATKLNNAAGVGVQITIPHHTFLD